MKIYKSYKLKNIINIMIFFLILIVLLFFSKNNFENVKKSISIFISSIVPSLFPFILFTELIINTSILNSVQKYFGSFFTRIFNVSKNSSPAILTGFLCGFPMGASTVVKLYTQKQISRVQAVKLLEFVNNCNPAFIISTIGIGIFGNVRIGILFAISHYLSSILIGIFSCKIIHTDIIHENDTNLNSLNELNSLNQQNFFEILKKCIKNTFITLSMILGFTIIFNLLFNIISILMSTLNINENIICAMSSIFEITVGAQNIYNLSLSIDTKLLILSFSLRI